MNRRRFGIALSAAVAGVSAGATLRAQSEPQPKTGKADSKKKAAKHDCAGKNDCKGQGGCATGDHECAGKNSCKGKGGCHMTESPAKKAK